MGTFFFVGDECDVSVELSLPLIIDSVTLWDLFGVDLPDFSLLSPSLSIVSSTDFDLGFYEITKNLFVRTDYVKVSH